MKFESKILVREIKLCTHTYILQTKVSENPSKYAIVSVC